MSTETPTLLVALLIMLQINVIEPSFAGGNPQTNKPIETKILLLGNSIMYTGNLPFALTEVANDNDVSIHVDMYAKPGARVSDLIEDPQVIESLKNDGYDHIVFHDRGGDAICVIDDLEEDTCQNMLDAHHEIADAIRSNGARIYLLGTYQIRPSASLRIIEAEKRIAQQIGAKHISISEVWLKGMRELPEGQWLAPDGMHPGKLLTAFMALEIFATVFEQCPRITPMEGDLSLAIPSESRAELYTVKQKRIETAEVASRKEIRTLLAITRPNCISTGVDQ